MSEENNLEQEETVGSFNLNFDDEETAQESEAEPLDDEDVTILDEEGSDEELDETEEESEELEEDLEEGEEDEDFDDEVSYTPFVSPLIEEGILHIDEDKEYDDSPEGFAEILKDTVNHRFEEMLSSLPEDARKVIEVIQAGESLDAALDVYNSFDYSQVDLEDVDTQRELTKDYLIEKFPNWSEERLAKELQTREDLDDLPELAKEAQDFFIQKTEQEKEAYYEQVQARQEEARIAQERDFQEYTKLIDESEGFNGIKFNSNKQRDEFKRYAFEKGEDGLTQYERDTKNKEDQLALAWTRFNKQNMGAIERQAVTKASIQQKKILARLNQQDKNAKSGKAYADREARPKGELFIPPMDWIQ